MDRWSRVVFLRTGSIRSVDDLVASGSVWVEKSSGVPRSKGVQWCRRPAIAFDLSKGVLEGPLGDIGSIPN